MHRMPAEIGAAQGIKYGGASSCEPHAAIRASRSSALHCLLRNLAATKRAACEMHLGDVSLPELVCRSDYCPEERSNVQVFLKVDTGCAMLFQIIRIVPRQVCSALRSARPQR